MVMKTGKVWENPHNALILSFGENIIFLSQIKDNALMNG
jgi:hypothetical protein